MGVRLLPGTTEYVTLHKRITRARGRADLQICVDCDKQARDWSLMDGGDQLDYDDYEPRCRSCHKKNDITDEVKLKMSIGLKGVRNGERVNSATLTEAKVLEIRQLWESRLYSQVEIAYMFNVSQTCVSKIVLRKTWHHV